jgi:hypothetical protein
MGGKTTKRTNSGAISIPGRPGIKARTTPIETKSIEDGILSRRANTAMAAFTASRRTKICIVETIDASVGNNAAFNITP